MKKKSNHWSFRITALVFFVATMLSHTLLAQSDSIDLYLQGIMKQRAIPGLQLAVVRNGKVIKSTAYGVADMELAVPVTSKTVFPLNSLTKAFTGVAIMQLVEDGKLSLEAPVANYLTDLPASWGQVSIKQLLTHTSGLPDALDPQTYNWLISSLEDSAWTNITNKPMDFAAGEQFSYNQTGYILLGRIINKLSGQDFTQFITEQQLINAGLKQSSFGDYKNVVPNRSKSYSFSKGIHSHLAEEVPLPARTAAGLNSTAEDLALWSIALQKGQLLKDAKSLDVLWSPVLLNSGRQPGFTRLLNGYGLGWPVLSRSEHAAVGGVGGGRSAFVIYPADSLTIVVLTNRMGSAPESFIDELAAFYIPSMKTSKGFGLPPDIRLLHNELTIKGFHQAPKVLKELKRKNASYAPAEGALNAWGYSLWKQNRLADAIEIFKLNVQLYPTSGNAYDSYAEALMTAGKKELAIKNYKLSLKYDPKNTAAVENLKVLEGQ